MELLWRWIGQQDRAALQHLAGLPVLPVLSLPSLPATPPAPDQQQPPPEQATTAGALAPLGSKPHTEVLIVSEAELQLLATFHRQLQRQHPPSAAATAAPQPASATAPAAAVGQGGQGGTAAPGDGGAGDAGGGGQVGAVLWSLVKLGCAAVDVRAFPSLPAQLLASSHCHVLDGAGALAALSHARGRAVAAGGGWERAARALPARCRHALRAFLVTPEALGAVARGVVAGGGGLGGAARQRGGGGGGGAAGGTQNHLMDPKPLLQTLTALPVFLPAAAAGGGGGGAGGQAAAAAAVAPVQELCDLTGPCFLLPDGENPRLGLSRMA